MVLVATILDNGSVVTVYAPRPMSITEVRNAVVEFDQDPKGVMWFPAEFRVIAGDDSPAPSNLPPDLSESNHGDERYM